MGLFRKKKQKKEMIIQEPVLTKKTGRNRIIGSIGQPWVLQGLAVCFVCAVIFSGFYNFFRANAEKNMSSPIENEDNISWLYQSCYLLYCDLYNAQAEESLDYVNLYVKMEEEYEWLLDEDELNDYMRRLEEGEGAEYIEEVEGEEKTEENDETKGGLSYSACVELDNELDRFANYFHSLEGYFPNLNKGYDYIIQDSQTGKYITNMSLDDLNRGKDEEYFYLSFLFDDQGNVTIGEDICGVDINQVRKLANEVIRSNATQSLASEINKYGKMMVPENCQVSFAISKSTWEKMGGGYDSDIWGGYPITDGYSIRYSHFTYGVVLSAYLNSGVMEILFLFFIGVVLLGAFLPMPKGIKPWRDVKICALPFEAFFCIGILVCAVSDTVIKIIAYVASGRANGLAAEYLPMFGGRTRGLVIFFNLLVLMAFFFCGWYFGIGARALRELGIKEYIKQRSLIYRFFPFVKGKAIGVYKAVVHLDLTQNAQRVILKLVLLNAVILFFICSLWIGGFLITLIYSAVLYMILRKYVSDLQQKYRVLLKAVDEIANGNLNVTINEDLGVFEPFREQVFKIQDGLKKAVTMEVRSQRIKTELVTNMSHDLKTPLTAIITYVNLLKKEDVTEQQRREYLEILERKSLRLKSLIEDLFEFSKANSQNITLNIMDVDIMNLVKQVEFEMSDKISESGLDVRMNLTDEKVILPLDSQKTYRIYENLFANIAKYALAGTRVYVNGFRIDDTVVITLKNISAQEITVEATELTERFVRGNTSRSTEGSGLGLAIAKSFMELQGGTLELEVDGDLFKVTTTWHIKGKDELRIT